MPEHSKGGLRIGQLNLRMPGKSAETGNRVANAIGQSLAQRVPPGIERGLGGLTIRVQMPAGATEAEISNAVAERIIRSLRK